MEPGDELKLKDTLPVVVVMLPGLVGDSHSCELGSVVVVER